MLPPIGFWNICWQKSAVNSTEDSGNPSDAGDLVYLSGCQSETDKSIQIKANHRREYRVVWAVHRRGLSKVRPRWNCRDAKSVQINATKQIWHWTHASKQIEEKATSWSNPFSLKVMPLRSHDDAVCFYVEFAKNGVYRGEMKSEPGSNL